MDTTELTDVEIKISADDTDKDGFVSIWNVASASMDGDTTMARVLASKIIGFLCKHRCNFVLVSQNDATYLDDWFERDKSILYDWNPDSEKVDVITQHAHVPAEAIVDFLETKKFKPGVKYAPKRSIRVEWFQEDWNVG
ncbi:MAG: hypothetical protein KDB27_21405 [Planctomycetales bacterium]|nr:hypothetical protein [Planctomycetales bacterium]